MLPYPVHFHSCRSGQRRFLTVSRVTSSEATLHKIRLLLTWNSRRAISQLLQSNPLTSKERLELHPRTDGSTVLDRGTREERQRGTTGRLMGAVPQIPPAPVNTEGSSCSGNPSAVFAYRNHIIRSLDANPILIVFGPPGSGKTTYLPQTRSIPFFRSVVLSGGLMQTESHLAEREYFALLKICYSFSV
ncbi:putative ATP-dependent RNA helicase YTHDC2 [Fasciola gigantica]|uniref:Putative ATP-dependent RNA helicase YTHDC2 n=1 Tax=Fasciola gigantica TaxID=46835 RepID=A0A504YK87_FASGI|nr:putative ATP-dependent RNA helicase YTHDC2 [Fasciola gigantica]